MTRRRLFASPLPDEPGQLTLDDEARRHAQVLRLSVGDALTLFDAAGHEADATVTESTRRTLSCAVSASRQLPAAEARVHLALCVPKAAKLELIVRMATELGVHAITLVQSERAVPKWGGDDPKHARLIRIAIEACAQSEQAYAPIVTGPLPLTAALEARPVGAFSCAFVERSSAPLPPTLPASTRDVWTIVGPEGGFAPHELTLIDAHGARFVSLGSAILRVETACVVACGLLLDRIRLRA